MITFSRKNYYFFSRRNTNFEILSLRAIYFSDCVFNLTMLKLLDITNLIFSNKNIYRKKLNNGTTFLMITVRAQNKVESIFYKNKCIGHFTWIKVTPKLKIYTYVFS